MGSPPGFAPPRLSPAASMFRDYAFAYGLTPAQGADAIERLDRIERLLIRLLETLAEEGEEDQPTRTLDGEQAGSERDQTRSLDAG